MNAILLLKAMGEMGVRYPASHIDEIIDYTTKMYDNGRIITISDPNGLFAVAFFSITDSPEEFLKKGELVYKSHDPVGKIVYLEKLVSRGWNRELRIEFETELLKKYPNITHGVWHRWAKWGDRKVIGKRRLQNV